MKTVKLFDDYSTGDNYMKIIEDDQGDYHISIISNYHINGQLRIASSGTRYSGNIRKKIKELMDLIEQEGVVI